jgi:predicted ArsR family transcriptional regulator
MNSPNQSHTPARWTFLTNHAHALLALYRDGDLRQRDLAELVGITEGAVQRILHELEDSGYIETTRIGRRNHYEVHTGGGLRHPLEAHHSVGELLEQLASTPRPTAQGTNGAGLDLEMAAAS